MCKDLVWMLHNMSIADLTNQSLFYSFESFSLQHELMISHWSLSNRKFPHVSRTFLSILADLNNAAIWMVSTCPLISKSFTPFINPWYGDSTECPNFTSYHHHFNAPQLFQFSNKFEVSYLSFCFLAVLPCGQLEWECLLFSRFSFYC